METLFSLHKEPQGEDEGQWVQVAQLLLNRRKNLFTMRTINHGKNFPGTWQSVLHWRFSRSNWTG